MLEYLSIGQIVSTHGIKGEVKIYPLTDDINRFKRLKDIYIEFNNEHKKYNVSASKLLKNMAVLKLEGIDTVEQALSLRDKYVQVHRDKAVKLSKDSFFVADLLEMDVFEENHNLLGKLKDVMRTGSNDVYVIQTVEGTEILIPALKTVVKQIDVENKKIIVNLPEGLI